MVNDRICKGCAGAIGIVDAKDCLCVGAIRWVKEHLWVLTAAVVHTLSCVAILYLDLKPLFERVTTEDDNASGPYVAPVFHLLSTKYLGEFVVLMSFSMSRIYVLVSFGILCQHCYRHWQGPWDAPLPGDDPNSSSLAELEARQANGRRLYKNIAQQPLLVRARCRDPLARPCCPCCVRWSRLDALAHPLALPRLDRPACPLP